MSEPITNAADAVAALGALPVPVGSEARTLDVVEHELDGANLALFEEELDNARLRLALKSAQRGRREARDLLAFAEASRRRWRDAEIASSRELKSLRARVAELEAERHVTNEALDDAVQELRKRERRDDAEARDPRSCSACGSLPEQWCPDCAACKDGCFDGFQGNRCSHASAPWALREPDVSVIKDETGATITISPAESGGA